MPRERRSLRRQLSSSFLCSTSSLLRLVLFYLHAPYPSKQIGAQMLFIERGCSTERGREKRAQSGKGAESKFEARWFSTTTKSVQGVPAVEAC